MFPSREPVKILGLKQTAWYSEHLRAPTFATLDDIGLIGWALSCRCPHFGLGKLKQRVQHLLFFVPPSNCLRKVSIDGADFCSMEPNKKSVHLGGQGCALLVAYSLFRQIF